VLHAMGRADEALAPPLNLVGTSAAAACCWPSACRRRCTKPENLLDGGAPFYNTSSAPTGASSPSVPSSRGLTYWVDLQPYKQQGLPDKKDNDG